jgi:hypothetical protein
MQINEKGIFSLLKINREKRDGTRDRRCNDRHSICYNYGGWVGGFGKFTPLKVNNECPVLLPE